MKKIIILTLLSIILLSTSYAANTTSVTPPTKENNSIITNISWHEYSSNVFQDAKAANHHVMIFAMSDECHWCQQMKATTLKDEKIIKMINENFYPVVLHADTNSKIAEKYQLDSVPTIIFFDDKGNVTKSITGYSNSADMIKYLNDIISGKS